MVFCHKCGSELPPNANYCNKCGTGLINPEPNDFVEKIPKTTKGANGFWYLAPIFFGIIGGLVAYFVVRKEDPKLARNCLIIGFVTFIVLIIFYASIGTSW